MPTYDFSDAVPMENRESPASILREAEAIINGKRREEYGGVLESFQQLADYWSIYLSRKLKVKVELHPLDVVNMMELMKVSRAQHGYHRDSYVDMAGYAGCAEKIMMEEANMRNADVRTGAYKD